MKKVLFDSPLGDGEENPDSQWLKKLMFARGNDFWDVGSGQAALNYYHDEEQTAYLHLKGLEECGFMLDHRYKDRDDRIHTLRFSDHTGETVTAVIGGNPAEYYREYFVPRETAWEAIEYFLQTGKRKANLRWEIAEMPEQEI